MLALKNNPKKYAGKRAWKSGRKPMSSARAGSLLELNTANYLRICGLNGLMAGEVPTLISKSKVAIYRELRTPGLHPIVRERLEDLLTNRRVPND